MKKVHFLAVTEPLWAAADPDKDKKAFTDCALGISRLDMGQCLCNVALPFVPLKPSDGAATIVRIHVSI